MWHTQSTPWALTDLTNLTKRGEGMAAASVMAQYGDSRAQQLETGNDSWQDNSMRSPSRTQQQTTPMGQRYAKESEEPESGSRLHYGSSSMPDVLPSGRDYPSARGSGRRVSHGRRRSSRKQSSTRPQPSFVAKGLLNLDNLQVKKSKTQPKWAKWSSNEGREGWVKEPRFNTRSEMKKFHAENLMPDQTFDVDGDGQVSAEDLKVAAKYDVNRDGLLQPEELRELRLGVVSEALDQVNRRLKSGQMYAHNPAVVQAVQGFHDVDAAVDHPDFSRKLAKLRACMSRSFEGRSSLNVREIMRQPRASDARHPERVPATPQYLKVARRSADKAIHAASGNITAEGSTPRWMAQRTGILEQEQAERDDLSQCESDLDTVQQLSPHTSGCKTKSELLGARKQEITSLATHYLDYENFGGDYHFPNAQREVRKREAESADRGRRSSRVQGSQRSGEWRTASFDPALGPPPSSTYGSQSRSKGGANRGQGSSKNGSRKPMPRVQGCGTHIQIFSDPEAEAVVPGAKAGRDGPVFQGGRLPTPLYDSISVATFAKPLEGQRTPGGRKV